MNIPFEYQLTQIVDELGIMGEQERVTAIKEVIEHFNQTTCRGRKGIGRGEGRRMELRTIE